MDVVIFKRKTYKSHEWYGLTFTFWVIVLYFRVIVLYWKLLYSCLRNSFIYDFLISALKWRKKQKLYTMEILKLFGYKIIFFNLRQIFFTRNTHQHLKFHAIGRYLFAKKVYIEKYGRHISHHLSRLNILQNSDGIFKQFFMF